MKSLEDRYELREGTVLMSGTQALARLPIEQRWRDIAAGLNSGGFISGYRGSPLGNYDKELWRIEDRLRALNIRFQPGVNEDLAATAVWGTQYVNLYAGATVEGVFGIWYGKSPGVDRSGDAFQHANSAGTAPRGGVVALVGDDHGAKSSSRAGQSEMQLKACGMPVLYPSSTQEILDYGLHGIAMSRHAGCWVALKLVTDVVEASSAVQVGASHVSIRVPDQAPEVAGGLHIRTNESPLDMEARLYEHKLPAATAYARANGLNRVHLNPAVPRLGIIAAGKSWNDARGALSLLGLDDAAAERAGLRLLKLGMIWPLDSETVEAFAVGLEQILVIEEKRPFVEELVKVVLQDGPTTRHVRVIGKKRADGRQQAADEAEGLPLSGELSAPILARVIARALGVDAPAPASPVTATAPLRLPNFCSGCPHNTSTVVPQGSRAMAGIGCHGMAMWIRPETTTTVTHMGAEGMFWVGQSGFTDERHVFVNIGDGTFFHSGSLALRQAVAARMHMTYKVLFNGFVSMTGGQPHDGDLTVRRVVDIARAEGVGRVVVVADDIRRYDASTLPSGVPLWPRTELDRVQRELTAFAGVSVLVYDQACATELRRQRKRDPTLDAGKRTFIHPEVCEGCGDCGKVSNCMSIEPLETDLGRKRKINQSSCNQDFSCVDGFCPSFVTLVGAKPKKRRRSGASAPAMPMPEPLSPDRDYNMLIAGIGGTGIITIGAILAMAAHLDGAEVSVLDVTGLAQKYGAVMSHLRFMRPDGARSSARLGSGEVDLLLGCDLIVAAGQECLEKLARDRSWAVVDDAINPTAEFVKDADWRPDAELLVRALGRRVGPQVRVLQASRVATVLMGDAIALNMILLGAAWQLGRIPVRLQALQRAIELNKLEVDFNRESFEWGRQMVANPAFVAAAIASADATDSRVIDFVPRQLSRIEEIVSDRARRLTEYQDAAYALRYRVLVERVIAVDRRLDAEGRLSRAVARGYYKLLASKDEFEVARIYSSPSFRDRIATEFEGPYRIRFHLGAWPFARRTSPDGELRKAEVGAWILPAMHVLSRLRRLRGTWLDPFRRSVERMLDRELLGTYEQDIEVVLNGVSSHSLAKAVELAQWPEKVRGYGHVRAAHARAIEATRQSLRDALRMPSP